MQGWVSIHRKIMNNPVWQDPKLLKLWMFCLLEASHKEHEQLVGRQIVKLQPGEFVTGRYSLAEAYNNGMKKNEKVNERTLWRWMKSLEDGDFLTIKSTTKYSVISINNWNFYQQNDQQVSNKCPANDQQVSTNNNGNKGNNENLNEEEEEHIMRRILELLQKSKIVEEKDITEFLRDDIDDVITNFGFEQPEEMIIEAIKDAARGNGRTWKYVYVKLVDWKKKGIKTKADLENQSGGESTNGAKVYQHRAGNGRSTGKSAEQALREAEEARRAWGWGG